MAEKPRPEQGHSPPPTGWLMTLLIFSAGAVLLYVATHILIPRLSEQTGWEPVVCWFLLGGLGVFLPLVLLGWFMLRGETLPAGQSLWRDRLCFRPLDRGDWLWGIGSLFAIGAGFAVIQFTLEAITGSASAHPPFMAFEPLGSGRYWILAAWLPFWLLNILGEEFFWRGVLLPRQEAAMGKHAWIANTVGWTIFHLAFGWQLLVTLLPILIILPYVTQRRRNSSVAVLIHASLNGPGFLAVCFGLV